MSRIRTGMPQLVAIGETTRTPIDRETLDEYGRLFASLTDPQQRDAAYHLLQACRELLKCTSST